MSGIVLGIYITCLGIYAVAFWYLYDIKQELKQNNRYLIELVDKADKEGEG